MELYHSPPAETISCKRYFASLTKWDHPNRQQKYFSILAEWERAGRRYPFEQVATHIEQDDMSVVEVLAAYSDHAKAYYVHADGTPTGQIDRVMSALQGVRDLFAGKWGQSPFILTSRLSPC